MSPKIWTDVARALYLRQVFVREKRFRIAMQKSFIYSEVTKIEKRTQADQKNI